MKKSYTLDTICKLSQSGTLKNQISLKGIKLTISG